jgi:type I restriction enzyme S subunit
MKRYSVYKDSDIEWVGEIPDRWSTKPLFALFKERQVPNEGNAETNVLSLSYGRIIRRDVESNFGLLPESFETYNIVEPLDIVLRLTDLQNDKRSLRCGLVQEKGIITSAYLTLEKAKNVDCKYAYYLLHSYDLRKVFYSMGGGVRQAIKFDDLKRLPILLPSHEEQNSIASYLDRKTSHIDELIAKKQRMIELLKEERTAIINQAVTKGLNSKAEMKDTGIEWLGKIPRHWEIRKLRFVANVETGITPPSNESAYYENGDIDWFTPGDFNDSVFLRDSNKKITQKAVDDGVARLYKPFSVLMIGIGATLGKVGIIDKSASSNQQINAISFSDNLNPFYGAFLLRAISIPIISLSNSSTMAILNQSQTKNIMLVVPPMAEQNKITEFIKLTNMQMDKLLSKEQVQIDLLKEFRTSLISEAVTGKIDVRKN